jgi:hypothetical protein
METLRLTGSPEAILSWEKPFGPVQMTAIEPQGKTARIKPPTGQHILVPSSQFRKAAEAQGIKPKETVDIATNLPVWEFSATQYESLRGGTCSGDAKTFVISLPAKAGKKD